MDSGISYAQDLSRPAHAQLVGRKRRADDDSLLIPSAEAPDIVGRIPWDGPHKRIPDSTSSEAIPVWPPDSTQNGGLTEG